MSSEEEKNQNQEKGPQINKDSKLSSENDSLNKQMKEMYDNHKKESKINQTATSGIRRTTGATRNSRFSRKMTHSSATETK